MIVLRGRPAHYCGKPGYSNSDPRGSNPERTTRSLLHPRATSTVRTTARRTLRRELVDQNAKPFLIMPKTRRAGRKNQLRRLVARYYNSASNEFSPLIGAEYYNDNEYEQLFKQSANRDHSKSTTLIEWPSKLTPLTIEGPSLPSLKIPEDDPRRIRYMERRAEILYEYYGGATPDHQKTDENIIYLD